MSFELDERRKRTLVIAGIASIALVVISFLVSLGEDEKIENTTKIELDEPLNGEVFNNFDTIDNKAPIPNAQKFDYNNKANTQNTTNEINNSINRQNTIVSENTNEVITENIKPEVVEDTKKDEEVLQEKTQAYLYCGNFTSQALAESKKAEIAFVGVHSDIARYENKITLKIGPFATRDQAKVKFKSLSEQQLLSECVLVDE